MTDIETAEVEILEEADIVSARKAGRDMAALLGFRLVQCTQVATAISELARNILNYAGSGVVIIRALQRDDGVRGLEVVARDEGPGIADIGRAMRDGYSTSNGLGLGLPGSRRLMDRFDIESTPGQGTTVIMAKWRAG